VRVLQEAERDLAIKFVVFDEQDVRAAYLPQFNGRTRCGLVMGQFEEATYDSLQIAIEPGDRFFLYTDGILETANPAQEEFGTDRFMKFMETNNKLPAGPFADALLLELARWLEQPPGEGHKDDISLLAVDFTTRG